MARLICRQWTSKTTSCLEGEAPWETFSGMWPLILFGSGQCKSEHSSLNSEGERSSRGAGDGDDVPVGNRGSAVVPSGWETCTLARHVLRAQEIAFIGCPLKTVE